MNAAGEHPYVGQQFMTNPDGTVVFTITEVRQRTIHFCGWGDTEARQINRNRWEELFTGGTLREVGN